MVIHKSGGGQKQRCAAQLPHWRCWLAPRFQAPRPLLRPASRHYAPTAWPARLCAPHPRCEACMLYACARAEPPAACSMRALRAAARVSPQAARAAGNGRSLTTLSPQLSLRGMGSTRHGAVLSMADSDTPTVDR